MEKLGVIATTIRLTDCVSADRSLLETRHSHFICIHAILYTTPSGHWVSQQLCNWAGASLWNIFMTFLPSVTSTTICLMRYADDATFTALPYGSHVNNTPKQRLHWHRGRQMWLAGGVQRITCCWMLHKLLLSLFFKPVFTMFPSVRMHKKEVHTFKLLGVILDRESSPPTSNFICSKRRRRTNWLLMIIHVCTIYMNNTNSMSRPGCGLVWTSKVVSITITFTHEFAL